ncbi:MAG: NDP-sugar synthase [Bdellovibrionota bacterium]
MSLQEGMFLCAGLSTRMRPLTDQIPKVLLPLGTKNIFSWTMQYFSTQHIARVAVNLHHGAQAMYDFLDQNDFKQEIHTFEESTILGTGGALKNMQSFVTQDHFFVMNCDIMTELDLQKMYHWHVKNNAMATLYIAPDPSQKYTKIHAGASKQITSILSATPDHEYMGMFGGITIFSKKIFTHMPLQKQFCLVRDLLEPLCLNNEAIFAYQDSSTWMDTGEIELYQNTIKAITQKPLSWM